MRARFPDVPATWLGRLHDVSALCAASDAVILPSRFETFGLVVLETLASESPQLGERSRDHVARNFTLPGMGDVLNDALEQTLRGGFGA